LVQLMILDGGVHMNKNYGCHGCMFISTDLKNGPCDPCSANDAWKPENWMTGKEHKIKTVSPFFEDIESGKKKFEIRKNDRNYQVGDLLVLSHWDHQSKCFTGRQIYGRVDYILDDRRFIQEGYICMSITKLMWGRRCFSNIRGF